ncbi:ATP-binding protein [Cupriavidus sp. 2SB]|uniref:sensor histidine kinase n=1 Tax=Cupriavidus sp. 2SB TaxID=2502199 RepID=UPI0014859FBE|nr:ATP-binding protein [Cupriavidus sp. 2SB]
MVTAIAATIFAIDSMPGLDYAIAALHVIVVLMCQWVLRPRQILYVTGLCMLLALCAFGISSQGVFHADSAVRCGVSLAAISIAGYLGYRSRMAIDAMRRQGIELGRTTALLAGAQALSRTGSLSLDVATRSLTWSEQTARIFGLPPETQPTIELLLTHVHRADREMVREMIDEAILGAPSLEMEHRLEWPDGSVRHVRFRANQAIGVSGGLEYHGVLIDVTDSHRQHEAMQSLQSELAHVGRVATLGELSASLAHEIRQPLGAIALHSGSALRWLCRTDPNLAEATANLGHIRAAAERAEAVVESLRKLSRPDSGEYRCFCLGEAIAETLPLLRHDLNRTGTSLEIDLSDDLPQVAGDRVQIQQVVLNLILNGLQAIAACDMDQGRMRICGWVDATQMVWIRITDNGAGIASDDMKRIFTPFFTTKSEGMGMGLSICRTIIAHHGGTLSASSRPGKTEFVFSLKRVLH